MAQDIKTQNSGKQAAAARRTEKLEAALRANLKRRKEQVRERAAGAREPEPGEAH